MTERVRGSSEIPLTSQGLQAAHDLAGKLASQGGFDEIHASSLGRTMNTAKMISKATHAPIVYSGDQLHPWHLGSLEGQPITPEMASYMHSLIKDTPDYAPPGRGPLSTADGESFNSFKGRTLDKIKSLLKQSRIDPTKKIGVVTHYRVKKLIDSYLQAGADPDSNDVDLDEMVRHSTDNKPGSIDRLTMDPYAGPQMSDVDLDHPGGVLQGGIYIVRHERTPWNSTEP